MKHIILFEKYSEGNVIGDEPDIKKIIMNLKRISADDKNMACSLSQYITKAGNSKISGLLLPEELKVRIESKGYPSGFSFGIDQHGYFIHTHRARSKSKDKISGITAEEMKFIDSTG